MVVTVLNRKWDKTNLHISTRNPDGNDTHQTDTSRQMRLKYHSYNKQPAAAAASTAAHLLTSAKDTDRQTDTFKCSECTQILTCVRSPLSGTTDTSVSNVQSRTSNIHPVYSGYVAPFYLADSSLSPANYSDI